MHTFQIILDKQNQSQTENTLLNELLDSEKNNNHDLLFRNLNKLLPIVEKQITLYPLENGDILRNLIERQFLNYFDHEVNDSSVNFSGFSILALDPINYDQITKEDLEGNRNKLKSRINLIQGGKNYSWTPSIDKRQYALRLIDIGMNSQLKLYKERTDLASGDFAVDGNKSETIEDVANETVDETTLVSILSIPCYFNLDKLLNFLDPFLNNNDLVGFRIVILKDKGEVFATFKFMSFSSALDFYNYFNGRPFDPNKLDYCFVLFTNPAQIKIKNNSDNQDLIFRKSFEIPSCQFCLVRLDVHLSGLRDIPNALDEHLLLSNKQICSMDSRKSECIICNYLFRVTNSVMSKELLKCETCDTEEDVWICLICYHIGCGRYHLAHARNHYEKTTHSLSLELSTGRIWDYLGDSYAHRLLNDPGSQLHSNLPSIDTESNSISNITPDNEHEILKLINELDNRVMSFKQKQHNLQNEIDELLRIKKKAQSTLASHVQTQIEEKRLSQELLRQVQQNQKNLTRLMKKNEAVQKAKEEELTMVQNLRISLNSAEEHTKTLKNNYNEAEDQLNDLIFFIKAQRQIKKDMPELSQGSVIINVDPSSNIEGCAPIQNNLSNIGDHRSGEADKLKEKRKP